MPTVALVGYTNAGKTTLFNVLTRRRRRGVERAVRHARSAGPPGAAARQPRAARVRHGRLHRSAAARARGGVPRHARGGRRRRSRAARHRRRGAGPRPPHGTPCSRCSTRSARSTCRCSRSTTSAIALTADERRRLQEQDPGGALHLGAAAAGHRRADRDDRLAAGARRAPRHADLRPRRSRPIASASPASTATAASCSHETRDGQVSIVADVPRRLLGSTGSAADVGAVRRCVRRSRIDVIARCDGVCCVAVVCRSACAPKLAPAAGR